jgi:serine/threonine protein kinase
MPNHFLAAGVYGCVYYPGYTCQGNDLKKNKKWVSKLTNRSEKTDTEIEIGKRLKKVIGAEDHFILVYRDCSIPYNSLDQMKQGCDLVKKNKSYILLYSHYLPSMEFYKYLQANTLVIRVFRCYYQLYEKISILIKQKLVHHDLHFANILYSTENGKLYIIDFGLSMMTDQFHDKRYLSSVFSRYLPEWAWYTPEIHLVSYILQYGELTEKAVRQTMDMYLEKHDVFLLVPELRTQFKRDALDYFLPLVDLNTEDCLQHLLSFWNTWDYYELSLRFLHMYLENKVNYPAFYENLVSMTQANPEKRPRVLPVYNTIQSFDVTNSLTKYSSLDLAVATASFKKIDEH